MSSFFEAVWGSGPSDVFAVADDLVLHYDGTSWTEMPAHVPGSLHGVWGTGRGDVFAVGLGDVLHFDGSSWTRMRWELANDAGYVEAVWGDSRRTVLFGAASNGVYRLLRTSFDR